MNDEDRQPLIGDDDREEFAGPVSDIKQIIKRQNKRKSSKNGLGPSDILIADADDDDGDSVDDSAPDNVVSIFVVAFDTRHGNVLEWCLPETSDLESVEFKAMPSGAHTVPADFLYFRKDNLYGLSCFEKMAVESQQERGIRMKSVGVLATSYATLHRYKKFLETQVRHQLENPGDYQKLREYFEEKKGVLPSEINGTGRVYTKQISPASGDQNDLPSMKITHPSGCFTMFVRFFGESIFTLWKLVLLQKRMLFFSPPPIGVVCYRVYCTACLSKHRYTKRTRRTARPYFYVNIADIDHLEMEGAYVACTTERVFCEKPHLYDVYVDNRMIKSCDPALKYVLKTNKSDEEKYQHLLNMRQEHVFLERTGEAEHQTEEEMFISYFSRLNDKLFGVIYGIANTDNKQLTADHMRAIGLDPTADRQFMILLLETYGIDATLVVDNPCCPI